MSLEDQSLKKTLTQLSSITQIQIEHTIKAQPISQILRVNKLVKDSHIDLDFENWP